MQLHFTCLWSNFKASRFSISLAKNDTLAVFTVFVTYASSNNAVQRIAKLPYDRLKFTMNSEFTL